MAAAFKRFILACLDLPNLNPALHLLASRLTQIFLGLERESKLMKRLSCISNHK